MGSVFSPPAMPTPPPPPPLPPAAIPPTLANASAQTAGSNERARAALALGSGMSGTDRTGAQGDLGPLALAKTTLAGAPLGGAKSPLG